jgi:hypothetical protein
MIAFINKHRAIHGVEPICRVLPIAPSTYHAHAARRADPGKRPARAQRDAVLKIEIGCVYDKNFRVYGVRKVWRQLIPGRKTPIRHKYQAASQKKADSSSTRR